MLNLLLLLLLLLIYWDIKMALGCGASMKIWQMGYSDQRCVFSYSCENLYLVNFKSGGGGQISAAKVFIPFITVITVNLIPQASTQLHTDHGIYERVCSHRVHCRTKDWALSSFGTFEVKKPQLKKDTVISLYCSSPEYVQKQVRDTDKQRNTCCFSSWSAVL